MPVKIMVSSFEDRCKRFLFLAEDASIRHRNWLDWLDSLYRDNGPFDSLFPTEEERRKLRRTEYWSRVQAIGRRLSGYQPSGGLVQSLGFS